MGFTVLSTVCFFGSAVLPTNFLRILFGERTHHVDSLELVPPRREVHHLGLGRRQEDARQLRTHQLETCLDELNSDKSPKNQKVPINSFKKLKL